MTLQVYFCYRFFFFYRSNYILQKGILFETQFKIFRLYDNMNLTIHAKLKLKRVQIHQFRQVQFVY